MQIYKASNWESGSGRWYVADTSNLKENSAHWRHQLKITGLDSISFLEMLKNKFHASGFKYCKENDTLIFSFDTKELSSKYKNWLNAEARKLQYKI